jgi:hypothetical protein
MKHSETCRLDKQIEVLKKAIFQLGPMRPGTLSQQSRRSRAKEVYGSYWHLTWSAEGKAHTQYVPKQGLSQIRLEIRNGRRFRKLIERLMTVSIKRSRAVSLDALSRGGI